MRSEAEMLELILAFARSREEIRVVVMNGSRVNPNARKDPFQDYDIACYVTNVEPFRGDLNIPRYFGELIILQLPDDMGDPEPESEWQLCLPDAIYGRQPHRSELSPVGQGGGNPGGQPVGGAAG